MIALVLATPTDREFSFLGPVTRMGAVMNGTTHQEKRQIFIQNPLLGKLSEDEIEKLVTYSRVERYPAGERIFEKDSVGSCMMLVLRGSVRTSSISIDGREIVFRMMQPGEVVGEIAALDGGNRSGDAFAMTDCELLVLQRRDFIPLLEKRPDICLMLINILCDRLRKTSEQVEDLLFRHAEARIAKALLQLSERFGRPGANGRARELHLSQAELGNIIGITRESVNKQLKHWERDGYVHVAKELILVLNRQKPSKS